MISYIVKDGAIVGTADSVRIKGKLSKLLGTKVTDTLLTAAWFGGFKDNVGSVWTITTRPPGARSFVSAVRRATKVHGRTEHNGRGVYDMEFSDEFDWAEVKGRLKRFAELLKSKGELEKFTQGKNKNFGRFIEIQGTHRAFGSYRACRIYADGTGGVYMFVGYR